MPQTFLISILARLQAINVNVNHRRYVNRHFVRHAKDPRFMLRAHDTCYGSQFVKQSLLTRHIPWAPFLKKLLENTVEHVSWTSTQPRHQEKHDKLKRHQRNNAKANAKNAFHQHHIHMISHDYIFYSMATQGKAPKHSICHGFVNKMQHILSHQRVASHKTSQ